MRVIHGIKNGMVMQRDLASNTCAILIAIREASHPVASLGTLEHLDEELYRLTGIDVGGPYNLTIWDESGEQTFEDLWVGDVWILGGQSNMEGWGVLRERDVCYDKGPMPQIRAFYLDDHWDAARTQLHLPWTNCDVVLAEKFMRNCGKSLAERDVLSLEDAGVGPGLFFGKYMFVHNRIPQGLIPCAFGGTCMDDWSSENTTPTSQYRHMFRRFTECGSNVRGMFWYQGESDIEWMRTEKFTDRMVDFTDSLRKDFGLPNLPIVQVQIGHTEHFNNLILDNIAAWQKIRRHQYSMHERIPNFSTVSAANTYCHDLIHIDADSQETIGKAAAMEMCALLGETALAGPALHSIEVRRMEGHLYYGKTAVILTYDHVIGEFVSDGHPYGYSVTLFDEIPYLFPYKGICHIRLAHNQVFIVTEYSPEQLEHGYVWYGAGPNVVCNIHDAEGRAPLAMGPVKLSSQHE